MANIVNLKLKNGSDLIAILTKDEDKFVVVDNPVEIQTDPTHGFYAKSWLLFSDESLVTLDRSDIFYIQTANEKAIGYYEDFIDKVSADKSVVTDEDFTSDLEDVFTAMMESRTTVKH
jgi:hypothetical protein